MMAYMLAGHLVGDFLLQTRGMARYKTEKWSALILHALVYTAAVFVITLPEAVLSPYSAAIIFVFHAIIDRRKFVSWWCRHVTKSEGIQWLNVVTDQAFHVLVLWCVALFEGGFLWNVLR